MCTLLAHLCGLLLIPVFLSPASLLSLFFPILSFFFSFWGLKTMKGTGPP